ncbi:MAG: holo-ACP synthase [Armatimonadota bacterium]
MPILGVGTDIIETHRIKRMLEGNKRFADRVFTSAELEYSLPKRSRYANLAARFAVKEAVAKAFGRSFSWKDVEMVNGQDGKPVVNLYGRAREVAGSAKVHVSVSHTKNYASAVAVVEVDE